MARCFYTKCWWNKLRWLHQWLTESSLMIQTFPRKRAEGNFGIFSYLASSTKILYDIEKLEFVEETMMDKKTQTIGVICSIVQIILSIICLIYSAINQENIIVWVLFLCSGILSLSSNISRNNKKEDEWGSANSNLLN